MAGEALSADGATGLMKTLTGLTGGGASPGGGASAAGLGGLLGGLAGGGGVAWGKCSAVSSRTLPPWSKASRWPRICSAIGWVPGLASQVGVKPQAME
jgi:hypothetical protein